MRNLSLTIYLSGPVRVVDDTGVDLTPSLMKAKALIAMLALAPEHRRTRAWVRDKLWSTKTAKESATGLRYVLWHIRKCFGSYRTALVTTNDTIQFDPSMVRICRSSVTDVESQNDAEFAEGLDVDDPEFEDWLREQRLFPAARGAPKAFVSTAPAQTARSFVQIYPDGDVPDEEHALQLSLARAIGARVRKGCGAIVRLGATTPPPSGEFGRKLRLDLQLSRRGGHVSAHLCASDLIRDEIVWAEDRVLNGLDRDKAPLTLFANIAAHAVSQELCRVPAGATDAERCSAALCKALSLPASFDGGRLTNAITTLEDLEADGIAALCAARRALYLGWLVIEKKAACSKSALDEARSLARLSMELDPGLAEAFAVRSELADFDRRPDLAYEYAERAVSLDPADPISLAAYAKACARVKRTDRAYQGAVAAQKLAAGAPNPAWWAVLCSSTAAQRGDYKTALRHAEFAHDLDPSFRPPLRFLAALRFSTKDWEGSGLALRQLADLEPGFTPAHLADPAYPLRSLKHSLLVEIADAKLV